MNEYRSYCCPISEHHPDHHKTLFMAQDDHLLVYCQRHKWLKIFFRKDGKNLNFKGANVMAEQLSKRRDEHVENKSFPMIAVGEFKLHK